MNALLEIEKEKLLYFILAYRQKIVLVKTGEKDAEKSFLGYEFSYRRGSEGIHPIQRGKSIDECTKLFDEKQFDNEEKASAYIYKAFSNDYEFPIHKSLKDNVFRMQLVDMLNFDRVGFSKVISTAVKKKIKIESKWDIVKLNDVAKIDYGTRIVRKTEEGMMYPVYGGGGETFRANSFNRKDAYIISRFGMSPDCVRFVSGEFFLNDSGMTLVSSNVLLNQKYLDYYLYLNQELVYLCGRGVAQKNIDIESFNLIPIPLPPKEVQQKIVSETEAMEKEEEKTKEKILEHKKSIQELINTAFLQYKPCLLGELCDSVEYGTSAKSDKTGKIPVIRMGNIHDGKIDWNDLVYSNDPEEIKRYSLENNDVLFNRTNSPELVGKSGIYKGERPAIFAGYLIRVNYKKDLLNPIFLVYILNSETIRNHGFSVMSKSVNQANINGTLLKAYRIPYPPIFEQQEIASKIDKIEIQVESLKKELEELSAQKELVLKKYL